MPTDLYNFCIPHHTPLVHTHLGKNRKGCALSVIQHMTYSLRAVVVIYATHTHTQTDSF